MKKDFSKIVVERPRHGSDRPSLKTGWATSSYDPDKHDDQPTRVSSSRFRQYGTPREFTDVLSPLRRFLDSAVGRPWNDVYSEIKGSLDSSTVTGRHIIDHAMQYVEKECFEHRGIIRSTRYGRPINGFYVHPRTGVLSYIKPESKAEIRARNNRPDPDTHKVGPLEFHKRLDGVWYHIALVKFAEFDYLRYRHRFDENGKLNAYGGYCITRKRQLGSKEIRTLNLHSTVAARA